MQVTIEKMVYGGAGLVRTDEGVLFVPRTAQGDVVEVEIYERKKDYSSAREERPSSLVTWSVMASQPPLTWR